MKTPVIFGVLACGMLAGVPWNSVSGQSAFKLPSDYFKSLLRFRLGPVEAERVLTYQIVLDDEKNGYCARRMDHGGSSYAFTMWDNKGQRVFGLSEPSPRDSDLLDTTFWKYNGGWVESKDTLPPLSLEDFWDERRTVPPELRPYAFFDIELPRKGTTVNVWLRGVCVHEACGNKDRVEREATYNKMELLFQYSKNRFIKGTKSLQR